MDLNCSWSGGYIVFIVIAIELEENAINVTIIAAFEDSKNGLPHLKTTASWLSKSCKDANTITYLHVCKDGFSFWEISVSEW